MFHHVFPPLKTQTGGQFSLARESSLLHNDPMDRENSCGFGTFWGPRGPGRVSLVFHWWVCPFCWGPPAPRGTISIISAAPKTHAHTHTHRSCWEVSGAQSLASEARMCVRVRTCMLSIIVSRCFHVTRNLGVCSGKQLGCFEEP